MRGKVYTQKEMESIIEDLNGGRLSFRQIAKKHDRTVHAVSYIAQVLRLYKRGSEAMYQDQYKSTLKRIMTYYARLNADKEENLDDRYDLLKKATDIYHSAVANFIEDEVYVRSKDIIKENIDLKKTVERLQKENDEYQRAFIEAKNSNWVDNLRRKWGNS